MMIERLSIKAQAAAEYVDDSCDPPFVGNWPDIIRAVLKELREPSDAMLMVANNFNLSSHQLYELHQAVIDKALEE